MALALEPAGNSVTPLKLAGDDHRLSYTETRVKMLAALEGFLAAHMGK